MYLQKEARKVYLEVWFALWSISSFEIGKSKSDSIWDLLIFIFCCFCFKNVAYSWKYTGWPILKPLTVKTIPLFHSYRIKRCRTENNNCLVGGLQEGYDLTYVDSCKKKGFLHQEISNNQLCPSLTLFKKNYSRLVALQCYVSFYCTAKWISYACTYVPSFLDFLPI